MCIPKNYKYKSHSLLRALPNLYDIKCIRILVYELESDRICIRCYEHKRPKDYKLTMRHGLVDGALTPQACQCGKNLMLVRSILRCDKCFGAYVQFIVNYRESYSYEIASLAIDVNTAEIINLSIYDENGLEIVVYS